jgi:hypothetical protein
VAAGRTVEYGAAVDAQRNSPDQAERGWYGDGRAPAEPEWEGYRLPGPRGSADVLQPDPLPYAAASLYPDSAPPAYADPVYPAPALEVPTGQMPPVPFRAAEAPPSPPPPVPSASPGPHAPPVPSAPPGPYAPPGPPAPGRPGMNEPQRFHAEPLDRAALRRPPAAQVAPVGEGVYRTRRPAVALLFAALTVLFEVPAVRLLVDAAVDGPVSSGGIVAGTFLVAGLPMFAIGLYALVTGATRGPADAPGRGVQLWLRPPAAYLPIALLLFLAAALATP